MDRVVRLLLDALALASPQLAEHGRRVAGFSHALALQLGLDQAQRQAFFTGALLHDVGFMKLAKPQGCSHHSLVFSDNDLYCQHVCLGEQMVLDYLSNDQVSSMVRGHHECFDGSGFPDGLAGEFIPLGSRIIAVIDCLDLLLVGDYCGEPRMRPVKAFAFLRQRAGRELDPVVVEAVIKLFADMPALVACFDQGTLWYAVQFLRLNQPLPEDLVSFDGATLLKKGTVITFELQQRIYASFADYRLQPSQTQGDS